MNTKVFNNSADFNMWSSPYPFQDNHQLPLYEHTGTKWFSVLQMQYSLLYGISTHNIPENDCSKIILTLYVPCIMFTSLFINQHLCTTICILNHKLVTAPTRYCVYWHHCQEALPNCRFFVTCLMIISTC